MSFLRYNTEKEIVEIIPEAKKYEEVINVHKLGDKFFEKVITYIYHTYYANHPLSYYGPLDRRDRVIQSYLPGSKWKDYEENKRVKKLISLYVKDSMSIAERFYESIKRDMDNLVEMIGDIPSEIEQNFEQTVNATFMYEGKQIKKDVYAKFKVKIDNWNEKYNAISKSEKIIALEEKFKKKINDERREKKRGTQQRMFDQRSK